jgi:curved DNA-binding protein CbpA
MGDLDRCYQMLGLKPGASAEEVNKAYKALVVIWHPDRIPKDSVDLLARAEHKLKEINQARDRLREFARSGATTANSTSTGASHGTKPPASPAEKARYHPYAAYRANYEARHHGTDAPPRQAAPKAESHGAAPKAKGANYDYYRSGYGAYGSYGGSRTSSEARSETTGERSSTARDQTGDAVASPAEPKPQAQDYYAQSRYNPAYDPAKQSTPPSPTSAPTAPPPPRPQYQPPPPMGYSPPRNHYQPPGTPQTPDLSGTDMAGQNLREKDLSNRNLSRANLSQADLSDAFLHRINLAGANLEGANLFRANLLEANLVGANMRNVNLIGADLSGCDLSGADLTGAHVGFDDRVMVKMTAAKLTGAIMPNGKVYGG